MSLATASIDDLAWAAGLFEGEGHIGSFTRRDHDSNQRAVSRASLSMTDEDVVERFQAVMGFGRIYIPRTPELQGRKRQWTWCTTTFEHGQATIALLWPWLSPRRREQARTALWRANLPERSRWKTKCRRGHPFTAENTYRWRGIRYCRACRADYARERRRESR